MDCVTHAKLVIYVAGLAKSPHVGAQQAPSGLLSLSTLWAFCPQAPLNGTANTVAVWTDVCIRVLLAVRLTPCVYWNKLPLARPCTGILCR